MKKIFLLLLLSPFFCTAQDEEPKLDNVKINLSSLAFKNLSLQYERSVSPKISVAFGFRYMPQSNFPVKTQLQNIINDPDVNINTFQAGNFAITPEVRFFFGEGTMHGFYIAPYARYASFTISGTGEYTSGTLHKSAVLDGTINSFSGGVYIGTQYYLGKSIVLDIWILGGHYGSNSGNINLTVTPQLNSFEQQILKQNLDAIDASPFIVSNTVNANGAQLMFKPWMGFRGLGVNLGFCF